MNVGIARPILGPIKTEKQTTYLENVVVSRYLPTLSPFAGEKGVVHSLHRSFSHQENLQPMPTVTTGLEVLLHDPPKSVRGKRLGLLCNPASVDRHLVHGRHLIHQKLPGQLKALYSPQHGFFAEKQDNMIESTDRCDPSTGLPVFSLYGSTRIPTRDMMDPIDIMLVDLQDVGTRVYTFIYTLSHCMEAARKYGKQIMVLDRPNPIGGIQVEGNLLAADCASFVGRYPIPMRHGLTIGEIAILFNTCFSIGCELKVVTMEGWRRNMLFADTGLTWVAPSPNLPTPTSALVYPGQVIWEGTNVSEGRGTTQPFELFGAPYLDPQRLLSKMDEQVMKGVALRPLEFEPTANKWAGQSCRGFQIHVLDPGVYAPYSLSLNLYQAIYHTYPDRFSYKQPPYEYEFERLPMDLILGDRNLRSLIEADTPIPEIVTTWQEDTTEYRKNIDPVLLYHD